MAEHRLYPEGTVPPVSTFEFHQYRERAPHLEQPVHQPRLLMAADLVREAAAEYYMPQPWPTVQPAGFTVSDLGCGDGGLLSMLSADDQIRAWGYDFQPSNRDGWRERGVTAYQRDVFNEGSRPAGTGLALGVASVATETLEHLADPHGAVRWIGQRSAYLVASSPWNEHPGSHDACHAWAWDQDGYRALLEQGGFEVRRHETVGQFQVILGRRR